MLSVLFQNKQLEFHSPGTEVSEEGEVSGDGELELGGLLLEVALGSDNLEGTGVIAGSGLLLNCEAESGVLLKSGEASGVLLNCGW